MRTPALGLTGFWVLHQHPMILLGLRPAFDDESNLFNELTEHKLPLLAGSLLQRLLLLDQCVNLIFIALSKT